LAKPGSQEKSEFNFSKNEIPNKIEEATMKQFLFLSLCTVMCLCTLTAQNRTVLCELFTSTTCPPCVGANQAFDTWMSTYSKANRIAVVKYHVWWPSPGNDPFYFANKPHSSTRNTFYGNNYAPHMFINGGDAGSSYSPWPASIETQLGIAPPLEIALSGSVNGSDVTVGITVTSGSTALPAGTLRLHVVATESGLVYTGTNGDPNHDHVMRKMLPDGSGETFTIGTNSSASFQRTLTLDPSWISANCRIVAFVQIQETKAVIQAATRSIPEITTGIPAASPVPTTFLLEQNFPNPFNPSTTIRYALPSSAHVRLTVHDILGREIATLVNEEQSAGWNELQWNAAGFVSGMYLVRMTAGEFVQTKKILLLK
jgi:hypothetical protein